MEINQTFKINKMKKNQSEVMEVEAEEMLPEVPLEKVIETALVKANVTDQVIAKLQETYGGMKLKSVDDKESYLEIYESRKQVRSVGILVEKCCKAGRQSAIEIQKMWLQKEKEILGKIAQVQDPLDAEIKKFEDEVARKEQEEQRKKEEQNINRQAKLSKYGAVYSNGNFELKHISYEAELIKNADEEMWNEVILPKYKKVYDEIETERVAEETKRKEESDRLKAEQEKFAEEQRKFKEQQDLFRQQQEQLQRQKDEQERQMRVEKERADELILKKRRERIDKRYDQLFALGMRLNGQYECYMYEDVNVDNKTEICLFNDAEWDELIKKITPAIEERKKAAEEKRLAKIEEEKQAAIVKALEEEKEKQRKIEAQRQADIDASNDKSKYEDTVSYLLKTPIHEMKSSIYKSKMNAIKDFINDLKS